METFVSRMSRFEGFEALDLGRLLRVGLDDADAGDVLLHAVRHRRKRLLHAAEALPRDGAEPEDQREQERESGSRARQRQAQVHARAHLEDGERAREQARAGQRKARAERHADGVDVVDGVGHEVARLLVVEEVRAQGLQVRKERVAQPHLHPARVAVDERAPDRPRQEDARGGRHHPAQRAEDRRAVDHGLAHQVHRLAQQARRNDVQRGVGDQEDEPGQIAPPFFLKKAAEYPHCVPPFCRRPLSMYGVVRLR